MKRPWTPDLRGDRLQLARSAFDGIARDPQFRIQISNIYQQRGAPQKGLSPELFLGLLVEDLLTKLEFLSKVQGSEEAKAALKRAKVAVDSAAAKWNKGKEYACTLLVSLTLKTMIQEGLITLEIED